MHATNYFDNLNVRNMLFAFMVCMACLAVPLPAQETATPEPATPASSSSAMPKRLDARTKIKLVAAIVALAILGFGLVALTYLGGKWTRRIVAAPPLDRWEDANALARDDWAEKPLTADEHRRIFGAGRASPPSKYSS